MKIGILTFSASHNCGSMLQAYALREVLTRKYGADVEIIDYSNKYSRRMYGMFDYSISRGAIEHNIRALKYRKTISASHADYNAFSDKYLVKSKEVYTQPKQLAKVNQKYNIVIAGGDQVWNVRCPDAGKEFYLSTIHGVKKVAYSPSLGGSNIFKHADNLDVYKQLLEEFAFLSVREPNGQKWLEELTGRTVPIVADPTLLLSPQEWCEYLPVPEVGGDYIFNYAFFHNKPETNQTIQEIAGKLNMPVIVMDYKSFEFYKLSSYGFQKYEKTGPLAFLGLMKNASLVLTQSFHGTLFSALFNRKFWSYNWPQAENPDDDRAIAILEQLGLRERYRYIADLGKMSKEELLQDIEYDTVNKKILSERKHAMDYIESVLAE